VPGREIEGLFREGLEALAQGNTLSALSSFEKAISIENTPVISSHYAFCIARARGQVHKAIALCEDAIKKEPDNSQHYLNLGRIYLVDHNKEHAMRIFREGLNCESNQQIIDELNKLGPRKRPVIPFLKRSNPVNKHLGIILRGKNKLRIRYTLVALLAMVVVATILHVLFLPEEQKTSVQQVKSEKENFVEAKSDTLQTPEVAEIPAEPVGVKKKAPIEAKPDALHNLELVAEDKTWVFISIDDQESKEMILNQGDHIKWSAKNGFSIRIGNAGGIKLIFDGQEIGPLGEKGQVINLNLPSPKLPGKDIGNYNQAE
jgi:tetratricopeptide (TPR) repeat protein